MPMLRVDAPTINLRYPYNKLILRALQAAAAPAEREVMHKLRGPQSPVPIGKPKKQHPKSRQPPYTPGRLRESLQVRWSPDYKLLELSWSAPYAPYVEEGADPHIITPVLAKVLVFWKGGRWVYAQRVHHPGSAGQYFARPSADIARKEFIKWFRQILESYGVATVRPRFGRGHWSSMRVKTG